MKENLIKLLSQENQHVKYFIQSNKAPMPQAARKIEEKQTKDVLCARKRRKRN